MPQAGDAKVPPPEPDRRSPQGASAVASGNKTASAVFRVDEGGQRPAPETAPGAGLGGRFRDHGAYVEDTKTGLLWQKDGATSGQLNRLAAQYAGGP